MAQGKRPERVAELLRMELADMIQHKLKDRRLGFVTVMGVTCSPDLKDATVHVSVMGTEKEKRDTLIGLDHAKGYMQHMVADVLRLRFTPRLHFKLDESLDHSMRISEILKEIHDKEDPKPVEGEENNAE